MNLIRNGILNLTHEWKTNSYSGPAFVQLFRIRCVRACICIHSSLLKIKSLLQCVPSTFIHFDDSFFSFTLSAFYFSIFSFVKLKRKKNGVHTFFISSLFVSAIVSLSLKNVVLLKNRKRFKSIFNEANFILYFNFESFFRTISPRFGPFFCMDICIKYRFFISVTFNGLSIDNMLILQKFHCCFFPCGDVKLGESFYNLKCRKKVQIQSEWWIQS